MANFQTTQWTLVLSAADASSVSREHALESLCRSYWYPLYSFVRRKGYAVHDAEDLTQGFFARFVQGDFLSGVSPDRGRFRTFLLTCIKHFLINESERASSAKRGGGRPALSWDADKAESRFVREPADGQSSDKQFQRQWAIALLAQCLEELGDQERTVGKNSRFEVLKVYLTGDQGVLSHTAAAEQLGLTPGAVKVAVHRLRQRYGQLIRAAVLQTLEDSGDLEDEISALLAAFRP